jgi:hypothetical protein
MRLGGSWHWSLLQAPIQAKQFRPTWYVQSLLYQLLFKYPPWGQIQSNPEIKSLTDRISSDQQAGGFDKLLLDSLYEDEARRQQIASVTYTGSLGAPNPFGANANDPFAMSSSFALPAHVQLTLMTQNQQQYYQAQQYFQPQQQFLQPQHQQQYFQQHQQASAMPTLNMYHHQYQYSVPPSGASNPFGDPFSDLAPMGAPGKQSNSVFL